MLAESYMPYLHSDDAGDNAITEAYQARIAAQTTEVQTSNQRVAEVRSPGQPC